MYGLISRLLISEPYGTDRFHMLGAARFMIAKKLTKRPPLRGGDGALAEFKAAIANIVELEPTEAETRMAAELEYLAREMDLELDGGESILCAILVSRNKDFVFTGDKRAITAVGALLSNQTAQGLSNKLVCLEQLFVWLVQRDDAGDVRTAVCSEPEVDKALTNCFGCRSHTSNATSWTEGLESYIGSIHAAAPCVLVNST